MSAIHTKSLTGITSITTPSGVDNVFTIHSNDTTERFRVDLNGNQSIAGILTVSQNLALNASGTTYPLVVHADADYKGIMVNGSYAPTIGFNILDNATPSWKLGIHGSSHHNFALSTGTGNSNKLIIQGASTGGKGLFYGDWYAPNLSMAGNLYQYDDTDTMLSFGYPSVPDTINLKTGGTTRLSVENSGIIVTGVTTMSGNLTISNTDPQLAIHDTNHNPSHYYLKGVSGAFKITDSTNGDRISLNANGSISITAGTTVFSGAAQVSTNLGVTGNLILSDQIIHSGDDNTKIRFPSADTVTVETGGSERFRITSAGGAIFNHTSVGTSYNFNGPSADNNWGGYLKLNSNNGSTVQAEIRTSTSGMMFGYGGTERLRIGSAGQLGVGSTAYYGQAGDCLVSQGTSVGVAYTAIPNIFDSSGQSISSYGKMKIKFKTVAVSGTGNVHLGLCRGGVPGNCPAGEIGIPIGFIPGCEYNASFTVGDISVTPWPSGSNRYEYYVNISAFSVAGSLGIFYLGQD